MSIESIGRPTRAEINLSNLSTNFFSVADYINHPISFMAVVKADAYGHGAVECALTLEAAGIDWFGVALPEEGVELRNAGITKPILCLGSFWKEQIETIVQYDITPVIYQLEIARQLDAYLKNLQVKTRAHIKVDTGMGRIGVRFDEVEGFAEKLVEFNNIEFEGIMTHFAAADNFQEKDFTNLQIARFEQSVTIFERCGFRFKYKDSANSPASLGYPQSHGDMVRLGGILYGLGDDVLPNWIEKPDLKPVLSLHSSVAHLKRIKAGETLGYSRTFRAEKDSLIASIPIGYQDGYRRALSNRGKVIINNKFAPVVGRISMDWTLVDVTDIHGVQVGDQATLIGDQGNLQIKTEELAAAVDTISYEITCGINRRVPRIYVKGE